ncbi:major facilitator superfamily domain-containing protein [Ilyonectria robusta]|uniref:major facilitator superfamily domain-containing protein n=1 Tax=Ilyonectria robusta TaxID=1079257 RepID=UPI001E8DBF2E|nr:major facilitator superfamily domain-containing protein [Ilyonectria robusta]KAH8699671.1 major facilitator superfamily domain-containing protein [Ilyonectria robusta]
MRISWRLGMGHVESVDDYVGVLVPLEQAHLYGQSAKSGKKARSQTQDDDQLDDEETKDGDYEMQGMLQKNVGGYTIEGLRREMREGRQGRWTTYEIKSKLINKAIGDIGMGSYNWQLFTLCGFGWLADNLWLQGVSLTLPSLSAEFGVHEKTVRYTTSALFVGLSAGSFFWGIGSDFLGRRIAFNTTLLITSVFGIMAAYAQSWGAVCFLFGALGFGVGGSLPVDGALFLEFLPDASSALLTLLSVWWPIGQLVASLVAWYFIARWPVEQGWRYFVVTIGIITFAMFVIRFFIFHLFESPKFLLNKGRQNEAVAVVHGLAFRNHTKTWLTSELLDQVACSDDEPGSSSAVSQIPSHATSGVIMGKLKGFSGERLKPLFKTKTLGITTVLIWFCWATIGMGYPLFNAFLPQYFARTHADADADSFQSETAAISAATYRNYAITSIMGVPGSLLAAYLVDHPSPFLGRRGTLASSTFISAIFLFLFVIYGTTPSTQLFFSCVEAFSQNIMYGVLYTITPEIFPAPVRGAGTGVASFLNRITGLMAPVLAATVPGDGATTPIYMSAALILSAFIGMCMIPIETRGAERL